MTTKSVVVLVVFVVLVILSWPATFFFCATFGLGRQLFF